MTLSSTRRRSIAFFIGFCVILVGLAAALNIGWILLTWREVLTAIAGLIFFAVIIAGVILNTIFLVREIRRNEQQDAFLNAMTHELKTPLASIQLYLDTLQAHDLDPAKRSEFYGIMSAESHRLLNTIEQVLQAGRVSRGKALLHRAIVDLAEVAEDCVLLARRQHHLPAEALQFTTPSSEYLVRGDREELRAAVSNLIDNAVKYSNAQVRIRVELDSLGLKHHAVRVVDEGIGIPPGELKQIFKRFYRIPYVTARIKGTGLGLFIVQSVARKHGGRAYASSAGIGKGSTFTLQLPAASQA